MAFVYEWAVEVRLDEIFCIFTLPKFSWEYRDFLRGFRKSIYCKVYIYVNNALPNGAISPTTILSILKSFTQFSVSGWLKTLKQNSWNVRIGNKDHLLHFTTTYRIVRHHYTPETSLPTVCLTLLSRKENFYTANFKIPFNRNFIIVCNKYQRHQRFWNFPIKYPYFQYFLQWNLRQILALPFSWKFVAVVRDLVTAPSPLKGHYWNTVALYCFEEGNE